MGVVMTKCSKTGRPFATGLAAEPDSFQRMPVFFARAYCTHCRQEHQWFAKDAWVAEEAKAESAAA
jgi:hypothetical protein